MSDELVELVARASEQGTDAINDLFDEIDPSTHEAISFAIYDALVSLIRAIQSSGKWRVVDADDWHAAECSGEVVVAVREAAKRVTGGNCSFAIDDVRAMEAVANRSVEAILRQAYAAWVKSRAAAPTLEPVE
ncbi:MAG: hypothetical protein KGL39_51985 [Patescibacteria group bacterium]|nr:hypothetical protein [Patescibacteria group bacterium]